MNNEALYVIGLYGSGDKISFVLQDWELAKVAKVAFRYHMALDILCQEEMCGVERRRGWFGFRAGLLSSSFSLLIL